MKKALFIGFMAFCALAVAFPAAALTDLEKVGKKIYEDTDLSLNFNQSCKTCHHPGAGFADPDNKMEPALFPVSEGSLGNVFGGANAPTAAYAGFSPVLDYVKDPATDEYLWTGGMFWNGRATGWRLADPLAEQALGPFENPVEMGVTRTIVVNRVQASNYAQFFERVFSNDSWGWAGWGDINGTYDLIGRAIAAFERSQPVTRFNSRFDQFFWACEAAGIDVSQIDMNQNLGALPQGILTTGEMRGLALFNDAGKGNCAACHVTTADRDPQGNALQPPLFTDFSYDNLGIPENDRLYELSQGTPPNLGLGGFLAGVDDLADRFPGATATAENGKFKVSTLRNVAKNPPYGHNGYFVTLTEIVDFYNTRDDGTWPAPEVSQNMNMTELGNLGLTDMQVQQIVAFMKTLNDN